MRRFLRDGWLLAQVVLYCLLLVLVVPVTLVVVLTGWYCTKEGWWSRGDKNH